MQMAKSKVLLNPPAWKRSGLEANIPFLSYLLIPLNLDFSYLRSRSILAHDTILYFIEIQERSIRLSIVPFIRIHLLDRILRVTTRYR